MVVMPHAVHAVPPAGQVRAPRVEEMSSVEASMRLDAVASAGFRVSRSKMMDLIKAGGQQVHSLLLPGVTAAD